jgi:hypothetical protein
MVEIQYRIVGVVLPLLFMLASSHCRPGGSVSARTEPEGRTNERALVTPRPGADEESRMAMLTEQLVARAKAPERSTVDAWDQVSDVSSAIRARIELLRAGVVPGDDVPIVRARAAAAAAWVLSYEAEAELGRQFGRRALSGARGWGTSKPTRIGPVVTNLAVDAYGTATTLGGLAELAEYAAEQGERQVATELFAGLSTVADHWLQKRTFDVPGGGKAWEKIATSDPEIHQFIVFNTDAMFARDLMLLSSVGRLLGDNVRAESYERAAIAVGRRIRDSLVAPVVGADGRLRPDRWFYGEQVVGDGRLTPQRIEDANHASFTLDFIALAARRRLGGEGDPIFSERDLTALGGLLGEAVFVRRPDGEPAYSVFVDPSSVVERGERRKRSAAEFSFSAAPDHGRTMEVASWWKQLAGESRSLDMGLSIRTSWGWSEAVRNRADLLRQLGQYLESEGRLGARDAAGNMFLSRAVWLRMTRG